METEVTGMIQQSVSGFYKWQEILAFIKLFLEETITNYLQHHAGLYGTN